MSNGLLSMAAQEEREQRVYGVVVGEVINNLDLMTQGKVKVRLPFLGGIEPWARVAVLSAGSSCGTYFMPQQGDEVLVAFHHGDIREPYVIGSLWNAQDSPPASIPTDAISKRIIKTPAGHEIVLNDMEQSITVTSSTQQKVVIDATQIQISSTGGTAKITMDVSGSIKIEGKISIEIKSLASLTLKGATVSVESDGMMTLKSSGVLNIQGSVVKIN